MKKWIKLETNLLQDERIRQMLEKYGAKGLGVYVVIRLLADCDEGCVRNVVLCLLDKLARRRLVNDIMQGFGLFVIDKFDVVRVCAPSQAPAEVSVYTPAEAYTHDHIISLNKYTDVDVDIMRVRSCINSSYNYNPCRERNSNVRKFHTTTNKSNPHTLFLTKNPVVENGFATRYVTDTYRKDKNMPSRYRKQRVAGAHTTASRSSYKASRSSHNTLFLPPPADIMLKPMLV